VHLWTYGGGTNQQWLPVALDSTHYKFVNLNSGSCLDVPAASTTDGVQLDQYTCNGTGAQSWTLNAVGGSATSTPVPPTAIPTSVPATNTPIPTATGVTSSNGSPFSGTPYSIPGKVEAENYNTGGNGVAYGNTGSTTNQGGQYRSDGVGIEATTDTGGGFDVGWTATGEWLKYTVNVTTSGTYTFDFRIASANTGSALHLEVDGANVTGSLTIPNTGGWQTWTDVTKSGISLSTGQHVLRLVIDTGGMNINWMNLSQSSGSTNTPTFVPPTAIPTSSGGGPTCTAPAYSSIIAYVAGNTVYYAGHQWQAKWWTQGEAPSTGGTGVWTDLGSCSGGPTPMPTVIGAGNGISWSGRYFAPYVDVSAWPTFQLGTTTANQGIKYYTLAFIIDGGGCVAKWGGVTGLDQNFLLTDIGTVRSLGGDTIVSFGGASGQELAQVCTSVSSLQAQYQAVIDKYNFTRIDFDVEGAAVADPTSINRRNQALTGLEAAAKSAGRTLKVSYTLPILPTGLTQDGLNVLTSAVANGTTVDVVNVMAMDYGSVANPNTMGANAIQSGNSLFSQLKTIYPAKSTAQLWAMVGITPMIGMNDSSPEVFTLSDAQQLTTFAQQNNIGEIAMWSAGRDVQCTGTNSVSPSCSGVSQSPFAFSTIFQAFK